MPAAKKTTAKTTAPKVEEKEEVTSNEAEAPKVEAKPGATIAFVYNRNQKLMRTFTKEEHGKDFIAQAEALAAQPRRIGWKVIVQ